MGAAAAGAAVSLGTAAIGAVASSGKKSGSGSSGASSSSNVPWSVQQPYLSDGFTDAKAIYKDRQDVPLPTEYFAKTNDMQRGATQALYDQGMSSLGSFGNVTNGAAPLLGSGQSYVNTASGIAQNGLGQRDGTMTGLLSNYASTGSMPGQTGTDPMLAASLGQTAMGSLGSFGQAQSIAGRVANATPADAMRSTVNGANSYINNDVLQGQIDAVGTDIARNLGENTLYGIRQGAQTSGNVNSSREGALEAIGTRGAQENLANAAAAIRGSAYNAGAQIAAGQYAGGQANSLAAANALNTTGTAAGAIGSTLAAQQQNQGQFATTSRLGAATTTGSQDLAWNQADAAARLAANGQLGTGMQLGGQLTLQGAQGSLAGLTAAQGAGTYQQGQDQSAINNANNIWSAADTRNQSLLNDYWGIVGKPLGTQTEGTTSQSTNGPGALAGALGGLSTGYGAAQNLFGPDPFGLKGLGKSGSNYDPSKTGWGSDGFTGNQATQSNGANVLQDMGLYTPLGSF